MATTSKIPFSPITSAESNDFGYGATNGSNPWVDSLSYPAQWGSNFLVNTGLQIPEYNYYFASPADKDNPLLESQFSEGPPTGWEEIVETSDLLKQTYKDAFQTWSNATNLTFKEASSLESASVVIANVTLKNGGYLDEERQVGPVLGAHNGLSSSTTGDLATLPIITYVNAVPIAEDNNYGPGSEIFSTTIHETGHGIGLSHPHDRGLGVSSSGVFPGLLPNDAEAVLSTGLFGLVQMPFTVMSYRRGFINPTITDNNQLSPDIVASPMALDIAVGQIKYGTNRSTNKRDTIYSFNPDLWQCLYDAGGVDTVQVEKEGNDHYDRDITLNLRPAEMNAVRPDSGLPMEQYIFPVDDTLNKVFNTLISLSASSIGAPLGMGSQLADKVASLLESSNNDALINEKTLEAYHSANLLLKDLESANINILELISSADQYPDFFAAINNFNLSPEDLPKADNFINIIIALDSLAKEFSELTNKAYKSLFTDETGPNSYASNLALLNENQQALLKRSAEGIGGYPSIMKGLNGGFTIAAGVTIENASGGGGNDSLIGNAADNRLVGNEGDDLLNGYIGADTLIGGSGADVYAYATYQDSPAIAGRMDILADFESIDRISLKPLEEVINDERNAGTNRSTDDYRFTFVGSNPFSGRAGEVRFSDQLLTADINGDAMADLAILLPGVDTFQASNLITLSS